MVAFKLFNERKDGIHSLFIDNKKPIPIGEWVQAGAYLKKGFAFRPGWHSVGIPIAPHLSKKKRGWYMVELMEVRSQKRPHSQGGQWYLSEWMRVIERLP